jgi:hypothetical protein
MSELPVSLAANVGLHGLPRTQLLIDGQWRDAAGGKTFASVNPAIEQVIAEVSRA